ncbi:hypothetical protein GCK72_019550 [Caenorhabditis remanei]|uniref:Uncharacterized protein n=1 Tax=Caenorhabditis remanei TaxID=31234 RepID=A0A6A5GE91_CAERE|nr:hypothetical protein GCK72_019550 [Caenorhabditis remanei]KAF1752995.1 hypothetical protein GCK72_019550 [Caenorhabditis remanei]
MSEFSFSPYTYAYKSILGVQEYINHEYEMILMFPYLIISVTFCAALPHFLSDGICIQVFEPYPFGSVLIISRFHLINLNYVVPGNVIFTGSVTISIILLNYFVMRKIQERKMLNVSQSSSATLKIEKTLTGTMIILLIPLMINLFVSIGELFHFSFFSYILLFRPLFLDARVHVVTCYFYITHPVFKKPQTQVSASTNFSLVALKTVE